MVDGARRSGCPQELLQTIALLATEAVTNAVEYGPDGGEVAVSVAVADGGWRVAVTDESPALPVVRHVDPRAVGGRGVMLIDRMASAWGVERHESGAKTVWFTVAPPVDQLRT